MSAGIVAVRRNLTPGAVFFRQQGRLVQYSLDGESWQDAFYLPAGADAPDETVPPARVDWAFTLNFFTQINARTSVGDVISMFDETDVPDRVCRAAALLVYHASTLPELKIPPVQYDRVDPFTARQDAIFGTDVRFISQLIRAARQAAAPVLDTLVAAFETSWIARELGWQIGQTEAIYQEFIDFIEGVEPVSRDSLDQVICLINEAMTQPNAGLLEWMAIDWTQIDDPNTAAVFAGLWNYDLYPMFLALVADARLLQAADEAVCPCVDCRRFVADEHAALIDGVARGVFVALAKDTTGNRNAHWLLDYRWDDDPFQIPANTTFRMTCTVTLQGRAATVTNSNSVLPRLTIQAIYRIGSSDVFGSLVVRNLLDERGVGTAERELIIDVSDQFTSSRTLVGARVGLRTAYLATSPAPTATELSVYAGTRADLVRVRFCIEYP